MAFRRNRRTRRICCARNGFRDEAVGRSTTSRNFLPHLVILVVVRLLAEAPLASSRWHFLPSAVSPAISSGSLSSYSAAYISPPFCLTVGKQTSTIAGAAGPISAFLNVLPGSGGGGFFEVADQLQELRLLLGLQFLLGGDVQKARATPIARRRRPC